MEKDTEKDNHSPEDREAAIRKYLKKAEYGLGLPITPLENLLFYRYHNFSEIFPIILETAKTEEKREFLILTHKNELKASLIERKDQLRLMHIEKRIKTDAEKKRFWKENTEKNFDLSIGNLETLIEKIECFLEFLDGLKRTGPILETSVIVKKKINNPHEEAPLFTSYFKEGRDLTIICNKLLKGDFVKSINEQDYYWKKSKRQLSLFLERLIYHEKLSIKIPDKQFYISALKFFNRLTDANQPLKDMDNPETDANIIEKIDKAIKLK